MQIRIRDEALINIGSPTSPYSNGSRNKLKRRKNIENKLEQIQRRINQ